MYNKHKTPYATTMRVGRARPDSSALIVALLALIAIMLLPLAAVSAAKEDVTDERITSAIETDLIWHDAVPSHMIDVTVNDGVVVLSGSVSNLLAKERARDLAETIMGVRSVVNDVEVRPVARTDEEITRDVETALLMDPATDNYELDIAVRDGMVTLSGIVNSWAEKQLSADVVRGVKGVRGIVNDTRVLYTQERPPSEIQRDIERRIDGDPWINGALVDVTVDDDHVVELSGAIGSARMKRRLKTMAWVNGVSDVKSDEVEVRWWVDDTMKRKTELVDVSDEVIRESVTHALLYDPRVAGFKTAVSVSNGMVTLTGTVDNLEAKHAAEQDARNTLGVTWVRNFIRVRPDLVPTDQKLERQVREALARDVYVWSDDVAVDVRNGLVTLAGEVNTSYEKKRADEVARSVNGVAMVVNNVNYDYEWEEKDDWLIRLDVDDQLFWDPRVDQTDISIAVNNGVVTLTGDVDSWHERKVAEINAYEAGAKDVRNELDWLDFTLTPLSQNRQVRP